MKKNTSIRPENSQDFFTIKYDSEKVKLQLQKFVDHFLAKLEKTISDYTKEAIHKNYSKPSRTIEYVGNVKVLLPITYTGSFLTGLHTIAEKIGKHYHRRKAKTFYEVSGSVLINKKGMLRENIREALRISAIDIFRSFEAQFMKVINNGISIVQLAYNSSDRLINYIIDYPETIESITQDTSSRTIALIVTKGIILGRSNNTTLDLQYDKLKISKLYKKTGLIIEDENGELTYYARDGVDDTNQYGHRLPLEYEIKQETISEFLVSNHYYKDNQNRKMKYNYSFQGLTAQDISLMLKSSEDLDKSGLLFDMKKPIDLFIGRKGYIKNILDSIESEIVVISGLGGIGKSELAIKYSYTAYNKERNVIWINAETYDSIQKSFYRLAQEELKISIRNVDGETKILSSVMKDIYNTLADGKTLLIFDNAEEYLVIKDFLPSYNNNQFHILVTSTNLLWHNNRVKIRILSLNSFTELELTESMEVIKQFLGDTVRNEDIITLSKNLIIFLYL